MIENHSMNGKYEVTEIILQPRNWNGFTMVLDMRKNKLLHVYQLK